LSQLYGYIVGYQKESSEVYHRQLTALWRLRTAGNDLSRVRISLAELFGVAVIQDTVETVEAIAACADGSVMVATESRVYEVGPDESLLPGIGVGTELHRGDYLTGTLRLYTSLDTRRFYASNGLTLAQFRQDVPRLYIPLGMIGVPGMRSGFTPKWEEVDLVYEGATQGGLPKLKFSMALDSADQDTYWNAVWTSCDTQDVNLIECLSEYVTNPSPAIPGTVIGKINPMKFYMDNFLGVNLSVLVVDFDAISAYSTSLEQLGRLEPLLPANTMMLTVLRTTVDDEEYDLITAREQMDTSPGKNLATEDMDITAGPEGLQTRWVRKCR
jgi:hypothetical protein